MPYRINNPGGGDCGFYALAIGLIYVIQQEYYSTGKSKNFNRWQKEGDIGLSLQDILAIDLDWLAYFPHSYKKEQLFTLQMSLRNITVNVNKEDLLKRIHTELTSRDEQTQIEGSPIYGKFMELVQFYLTLARTNQYNEEALSRLTRISQYNELALSPEVLQLAQNTTRALLPKLKGQPFAKAQKIENAYVKEALVLDVLAISRGHHSAIMDGIEKIKQKGRWATHSDLNEIAHKLEVNLFVVGQVNGASIPDYPTVILNNENNAHWTTTVEHLFEQKPREVSTKRIAEETVIEQGVSRKHHKPNQETQIHSIKEEQVIGNTADNYKEHMNKLIEATTTQGFFTQVNKIPVNALDTAKAIGKESDQSFASRLQEAELRRVLG